MITYPQKFQNRQSFEEIQGFYGPIAISENLLQRAWLEQRFDGGLMQTHSGKKITVIHPGHWNFQEGPDFKNAVIQIENQKIYGDVEIHFSSNDWNTHGHHLDPAFSNVVLHAVFFRDSIKEPSVNTLEGSSPETFIMIDKLESDLESMALDNALLSLENCDTLSWIEEFLQDPYTKRLDTFLKKAKIRWEQKCQHAKKRLDTYGWDESCHQLCLEILGYRRNKIPMANFALEYPLSSLKDEELSAQEVFDFQKGNWKLAGIRPANHPKKRIQQYLDLIKENCQWPQTLLKLLESFIVPDTDTTDTAVFRRKYLLTSKRNQIKENVFSDILGAGTKLDTLMLDGFFPLMTVFSGKNYFQYWYHWYSGDFPEKMRSIMIPSDALNEPKQIISNGTNQATFQLYIEHDLK